MKKNIILLGTLLISGIAFSQVGINIETPKATLDVVGKPADNTSLDGIIAPRLTGDQLRAKTYTTDQTGTLVYITAADTAPDLQTVNVTSIGYYYFDGAVWQKVVNGSAAPVNIYNTNGSLTGSGGSRNLTLNGKELNFIGTDQRTSWGSNGVLWQENLQPTGSAAIAVEGGSNSTLFLQQFKESIAQIVTQRSSTGLSIETRGTTTSAPISFSTCPGSPDESVLGFERMRITGTGNLGVNTTGPTEKLHVNGITRLQGLPLNGTANAINTTSGGGASSSQDQTFTATRTVVADANGVLGYVTGLPTISTSGSINVGETVSRMYSIPAATANVNTFNLKTYVTANSLPALPLLDGLEMNLQGVNSNWYDPRIYNVATGTQLVSYQTFATQVNENETSLNNNLASGSFLQIDQNNVVLWTTTEAEVITTNLQVQIDANTYRWYEFKWWCMQIGSGATASKKIFLSVTRKA